MIVITLIIIYYIQHNKYMFVNSDKTRIFFLLQVRALGEDEKREREKILAQNKRFNKKFGNET